MPTPATRPAFEPLIDDKTKAVFCESIGNPQGNVTDIAALAEIAHRHGVPLIVDNTVATPYLLRPFEHGADIVVHSLTKYMGGHGTSIGGAIVDSGKFPWAEHKAKFKRLNEPDVELPRRGLHRGPGPAAYIGRARVVPLRNTGAALSPFNAFLILQGIETLALRMDRINDNTLKVAQFLQSAPQGRVGQLRRLAQPPRPRAGAEIPGRQGLWPAHLWRQVGTRRRAQGRCAFPGCAATVHAPGQHWRRQIAGHTPGLHHAPPARRRPN